jgi:hypothetical protein
MRARRRPPGFCADGELPGRTHTSVRAPEPASIVLSVGWWISVSTTVVSTRIRRPAATPFSLAIFKLSWADASQSCCFLRAFDASRSGRSRSRLSSQTASIASFTHLGNPLAAPDAKTMGRWGVAIGPEVLKRSTSPRPRPLHAIPRDMDQKAPRMPAAASSFDICLRAWNIRVLTVPSGTPTICATSLTSFPW